MTNSNPPLMNSSSRDVRAGRCRSGNGLMIAAIVLGFFVAWPIGLALLAWTIWHKEIRKATQSLVGKFREAQTPTVSGFHSMVSRKPSNASLASYLEAEQERLRDEQKKLDALVREFEAYQDAERAARDRKDFEAFLKRQDVDNNGDAGVIADK